MLNPSLSARAGESLLSTAYRTSSDTLPTSVKREVYRRLGSGTFWANTVLKYSTGVGLAYDVIRGGFAFLREEHDPTIRSIPIIGPNPEYGLFQDLEAFRFADGSCFDFRGDKARSVNGREGTLANSNQRAEKGFSVTWQADRTIGPIGKLKLDWIFVKAPLANPRDTSGSYGFAPHFGRTMYEVNYALEERLSDHNPISVDLPFAERPDDAASSR